MRRGRLAQAHVGRRVELAEGGTGRGMMGGGEAESLVHLFESLWSAVL